MSNRNLTIKFSRQKKSNCPGKYCTDNNIQNSYKRYAIFDKDSDTEIELLDYSFGRCDKKDKCRYQKTAKGLFYPILDTYKRTGNVYPTYPSAEEYKASNSNSKERSVYISRRNRKVINSIRVAKPIQSKSERLYIPSRSYNQFQFKSGDLPPFFFEGLPVEPELLEAVLLKYYIGVLKDKYVSKSNLLFPYIDIQNRLHGVEIKEFDKNRRTLKMPDGSKVNKQFHGYKSTSDSIRAVLGEIDGNKFLNDYQKQKPQKETCFGEHLITEDITNIVIHESCKNSILFDLFSNQKRVVNLATGSKNNLSVNRFKWISEPDYQHIEITLIPDSEAVEEWNDIIDKNFRNRTMISFEVIRPVDLMEPYFLKLDDNTFDFDDYLSNYFVEGILKIDIADLILDYWNFKSKERKKDAPRVHTVKQVETKATELSNSTEIERKLIKCDKSKVKRKNSKDNRDKSKSNQKEYRIEVNGKSSYIDSKTLLKDLPDKSVVTLREPKEWIRYNLFEMVNLSTSNRVIRKLPFFVPDSEVIKELGSDWSIQSKIEVDNRIKPVERKKDAPRVHTVKQVERLEDKSRNSTESPTSFIKRDLYDLSKERRKKLVQSKVQSKSKNKESQQLEMFV